MSYLAATFLRQMPVQNTPSGSSNSDKIGGWLIFAALNLIALPFSAYQTYRGYEPDLGWVIAGAVAALTTVFFITINYTIAQWRKSGKRVGALFILYILPLAFSFPGNFGAFYTQLTGTLKIDQWTTKRYSAQQNLSKAEQTIEQSNSIWMGMKEAYQVERQKAVDQFNNPGDPGAGEKFKGHYAKMAEHLGISGGFTRIRSRKLEDWMEPADNQFESRRMKVLEQVTCFESSRDALQDIYDEGEDDVLIAAWTDAMRGDHLNALATANNAMVSCIESHIGGGNASNALAQIEKMDNTDGFAWAFKSAYVDGEDPTNAAISTILALIIDLGVLLFIIILFKPEVRGRLTGRRNN